MWLRLMRGMLALHASQPKHVSGVLCRNLPNVHEERLLDNPEGWHGAELSVTIAGNWQYYRNKILKYLQQIAVITPYAQARATSVGDRG